MISVIMPVFNNLKYLKESIDSILNQTFTDFEFIIIDDGSEEPVYDFVKSYDDSRIIVKRNDSNRGLTESLNLCLDIAQGDVIARHDGDDISLPTRFEKQVDAFKDNIGLVTTWAYCIDKHGNKLENNVFTEELMKKPASYIKEHMLGGGRGHVMGPSAMYTREVFDKIGYYDEYFFYSQDYNYWLRLFRHFDLAILEDILFLHRVHKGMGRKMRPEKYRVTGKKRGKLIHSRAEKYTIIKNKGDYCDE